MRAVVRNLQRLALALGFVVVATAIAAAQMSDPPPRDPVQWQLEFVYDGRGVSPDGAHLGLLWKRVPERTTGVLVLRRAVPVGTEGVGRPVRAIDHPGPLLVPTFLYPSSPKVYHPAFDARGNAIPVGSKVGEWTVVAYADGDPQQPIVDEVETDTVYVYALIPATRAPDPDTYAVFGDAILTQAVVAEQAWFHRRWVQVAVLGVILGTPLLGLALRRRRRRRIAAQ